MTTDCVCAPKRLMSILSVSETFRRWHDGKKWLVIDFSIGQNGFNEKSNNVICIFQEFGEVEVKLLEQRSHVLMSRCWGDNDDESIFSASTIAALQQK